LVVFLFFSVCATFFAPDILLRTRLRQFILRSLLPDHAARLEIDSVTAGWRSPIAAHGIRYCDEAIELNIESARCDRTLLDLVLHPKDCGRVQLESTRLVILGTRRPPVASPAPSDSATPARVPMSSSSSQASVAHWPAIQLSGTHGELVVQGPDGRLSPIAHHLEFELDAPADSAKANFRMLARTGDLANTSHVSARGNVAWPVRSIPMSLNDLRLELVGFDIALLDPLLALGGIPVSAAVDREAPLRVQGIMTGNATLRGNMNRSIGIDVNMEIQPGELSGLRHEWSVREPLVRVTGVSRIASGSLQLDSMQIMTEALTLDATGRVTERSGDILADLQGTARCDWEKLGVRLQPFLHADVSVSGRSRRPWRFSGPLCADSVAHLLQTVRLDVATECDSLRLFDCEVGPLELVAHGHDGRIVFDPLTTPFQNGQIAIEPTIRFRSETPVLSVSPGRVLQNVTVDPKLCEWILRYADPLATVSGDLHGQLSLDLDELELPLVANGLERAVIRGRIMLDDVEFSPDRSLQEILAIAGIQIPENLRTSQTITIRLEDGRVYHAGLTIPLKDYPITLDGWVALDHSMQIRLSLPVTEQMLGRDKRLYRLLRGQRVDVPIAGTLERPKISEDALSRNIQRLIQTTLRENLMGEDSLRGLLRRAIK
jgi:hypothetical protein